MAISRILVPLDGSETSLRALDFAADLATPLGAVLDVVCVVDLGQLDFYDGMYHTPEQVEQVQQKVKLDVLDAAAHRLGSDGPVFTTTLLRGPVVKTLVKRIEDTDADLVVMGRTGKGMIERLVDGSVSRRLAAIAPAAVTLVG